MTTTLAPPDRRVFQRHEKKYLLTPAQYRDLLEALEPVTTAEPYGLHTICSLYYDTDDYAVIRHSLDKPVFKEKLRLRSYGVPGESDQVYLELKKKLEGITYKRRVPLPLWQARDYLMAGIAPDVADHPIFGEIDAYVRRRPLAARAVICTDRVALRGLEDPELRITIDTDIRWRGDRLDLSLGDRGELLLPPGTRVLEIKVQQALPLWLAALLSGLAVYPTGFSKYGTAYRLQVEARQLEEREGIRCVG